MRRVFCERLASAMRINNYRESTDSDPLEDVNRSLMDDVNVPNNVKLFDLTSSPTTSAAVAAAAASTDHSMSSVERLLASINDQLETKLRTDARLRHETDKKQQMMSEWMIAAAVIDRFCFIIFTIILVISTLIFALLLFFHA